MPTKDQVFAAATDLERRGERVTVRAVHAITGGSLRDLTPAVKEWQAEKAAIADAHQQAPEVPNEIRDLLTRAALEAWSLAHRHAGAEAAELRRQVRDLEQAAEAAAKDGDAVVAELEAELSAVRSELVRRHVIGAVRRHPGLRGVALA